MTWMRARWVAVFLWPTQTYLWIGFSSCPLSAGLWAFFSGLHQQPSFKWILNSRPLFYFSSFGIHLKIQLNLNKRKSPFYISVHSSCCHLIHRFFVFKMLLWLIPADMGRCPHYGFISTVYSSRSVHLQFCAGTVSVCQSPAGNACQHRWKWWRRGEYLNYVLGWVWDTPQPKSTWFILILGN